MTTSGTGKVTATGKIKAKYINTGVDFQGNVSDSTLQAALDAMFKLNTGGVEGQEIEVEEAINTGLRYVNPTAPTKAELEQELAALQQELTALAAEDAPAEVVEAAGEAGRALSELQKEEPKAERIISRLKFTLDLLTDASKALDGASKIGGYIAQAIPIALGLIKFVSVVL